MQQRKDEILAKKAKLAELRRQRELRQREFSQTRQSIGEGGSEILAPTPGRADSRAELDSLISRLVDRPSSAALKEGVESPKGRGSRPNSVLSASQLSGEILESVTPPTRPVSLSIATQTTPFPAAEPPTAAAVPPPKPEVVTYSKGVQTDSWTEPRSRSIDGNSGSEDDSSPTTSRANKRLSRRQQRERDEEIRGRLRKEVEEEIQSAKEMAGGGTTQKSTDIRYPLRTLTNDELNAVTSSNDFLDFVEKSSRVIERALDEQYDVLTDYALGGISANGGGENDEYGNDKKRRGIEELVQFYDERWSKKRMISDINFSPKFPELVLASYTNNVTAPHDPNGIVQVWNLHLHSRPEYVFHSMSDILTAKFSPFHPNLIVGGSYSGQVLLWDTRSSRAGGGAPVQKTPLTGSGHTHPGLHISIVEDLAPTTMTFPQSDPTFFLVGTEEGAIYPCHRYDRAGAKAGTDHRLSYRGHAAPVMSTIFHPARGAIDLGDLMLSSSLDWSVKLWRVRPPAVTSTSHTSATTPAQVVSPVLDLNREDVVYDARWSPHRPGVFALVDGAGSVEVWDLCTDTEVYAARATPTKARNAVIEQGLNKVAWEERDGRRLATGGLDGVVTVFEVGKDLSGGPDEVPTEEWSAMKKLVAKLEQGRD
ncbi:cytoplasmic dynein intermediate chain [Histoplasma capsulatum H143]|uniref:Cytoplasmic dynein intermediate chain n=1 Tax=Ajellomyces capsulatus (strain H143) TaxID=544712 RepID=C6HL64_AJECH|nr:cytoplasmic dynein intermediate chain [Histoplasma capsulatum H143]